MSENLSPLPAAHEPTEPLADTFDRYSAAVPAAASQPDVLIGISFDDPFRAEEFVLALHRLHAKGVLALHDVVVLTKDEEGNVRTRETSDIAPVRGRTPRSRHAHSGVHRQTGRRAPTERCPYSRFLGRRRTVTVATVS